MSMYVTLTCFSFVFTNVHKINGRKKMALDFVWRVYDYNIQLGDYVTVHVCLLAK